jgi:hypothetical protein
VVLRRAPAHPEVLWSWNPIGIHYEVWFERGPCPAALNRISGPLIDVRLGGNAMLIGNGGNGGNAGTGNSPGSPGPGGNPGLLLGQNGMNGLT